jgi:hypothetical protein
MGLSKKYNIELFDNISYIIKFISETSNVAMEDGQYIFIRNIGCFNLLLISLLLLSGDVEINPGPGGTSNISNENILSIFHCNIRSLRNKLNYIADIIEEFDRQIITIS